MMVVVVGRLLCWWSSLESCVVEVVVVMVVVGGGGGESLREKRGGEKNLLDLRGALTVALCGGGGVETAGEVVVLRSEERGERERVEMRR